MIGTHDSFSYRSSTNPLFNCLSFLWKTQTLSIKGQYYSGVRYFDIRVRRKNNGWQLCHGLVDFKDSYYNSIQDIIKEFPEDCYFRIILERGPISTFIEEINSLSCRILFSAIKNKWKVLINKDYPIVDYTYIPWHSSYSFIDNIKYLFKNISTIKKHAKKNNPEFIMQDHINDKILYFFDYYDYIY